MTTESQKQKVLKILSEIESTLKMTTGDFENIGVAIGLDGDELEEESRNTVYESNKAEVREKLHLYYIQVPEGEEL